MPMAEQQRATLCNRLWVSGCEALGDVCTRCGRWGISGTVGLGMCDKCVPLARQTTLILPGPERRRNPKRRRSPSESSALASTQCPIDVDTGASLMPVLRRLTRVGTCPAVVPQCPARAARTSAAHASPFVATPRGIVRRGENVTGAAWLLPRSALYHRGRPFTTAG